MSAPISFKQLLIATGLQTNLIMLKPELDRRKMPYALRRKRIVMAWLRVSESEEIERRLSIYDPKE